MLALCADLPAGRPPPWFEKHAQPDHHKGAASGESRNHLRQAGSARRGKPTWLQGLCRSGSAGKGRAGQAPDCRAHRRVHRCRFRVRLPQYNRRRQEEPLHRGWQDVRQAGGGTRHKQGGLLLLRHRALLGASISPGPSLLADCRICFGRGRDRAKWRRGTVRRGLPSWHTRRFCRREGQERARNPRTSPHNSGRHRRRFRLPDNRPQHPACRLRVAALWNHELLRDRRQGDCRKGQYGRDSGDGYIARFRSRRLPRLFRGGPPQQGHRPCLRTRFDDEGDNGFSRSQRGTCFTGNGVRRGAGLLGIRRANIARPPAREPYSPPDHSEVQQYRGCENRPHAWQQAPCQLHQGVRVHAASRHRPARRGEGASATVRDMGAGEAHPRGDGAGDIGYAAADGQRLQYHRQRRALHEAVRHFTRCRNRRHCHLSQRSEGDRPADPSRYLQENAGDSEVGNQLRGGPRRSRHRLARPRRRLHGRRQDWHGADAHKRRLLGEGLLVVVRRLCPGRESGFRHDRDPGPPARRADRGRRTPQGA